MTQEDWPQYVSEITRVLKSEGYFLNVVLSRETTSFYGWSPKHAENGSFEKFGVRYYFFTPDEIERLVTDTFQIVKQETAHFPSKSDPGDDIVLLFSLLQKK